MTHAADASPARDRDHGPPNGAPRRDRPHDAPSGAAARTDLREALQPMFDDLRRFTGRRIAELSAEIHAAVQIVGFSETSVTGQLGGLRDQISAIVAAPAAASRNSGMELAAVLRATEAAANQIMEAAEAIGEWMRDGRRDPESLQIVANRLNTIFEACTFQDVTGQRIQRAIQHLQEVESSLVNLMPEDERLKQPEIDLTLDPDLLQDDIDRVFASAGVDQAGVDQAGVDLAGVDQAGVDQAGVDQDRIDKLFANG